MKKDANKYVANFTLMLAGAVVGLLLAEGVLRIFVPHKQFYSIAPAIERQGRFGAYDLFPGLDSTFFYSSNDIGYRSANTFAENRLGILALGGSTTECTLVGDKLNWTWILEDMLNTKNPSNPVTIGNVAASGLNASHHFLQIKYLGDQIDNISKVMILVGINDYLRALGLQEKYVSYEDDPMVLRKTFVSYPPKLNDKWYQSTELWMHLRDFKRIYLKPDELSDEELRSLVLSSREEWKNSELKNKLPDLSEALEDYRSKISEIVALCQEKSLELILITQPVPWDHNMSTREKDLNSLVALFTAEFRYDFSTLYEGMNQFNAVLKSFDHEDGVKVIDLDAQIKKDTTVFYDHCHFNKSGTTQVANILFNELTPVLNKTPD